MFGHQPREFGVSRRLRRLRRIFLMVDYGLTRAYAKQRVLLEGFHISERQLVAPGKLGIDQALGQRAFSEFVQPWKQDEIEDQEKRGDSRHQLKSQAPVPNEKECRRNRSSNSHIQAAA